MQDDKNPPRYFDFSARQKQKAASRKRDEERLARGDISPMQLQRENSAFSHIKFTHFLLRGKSGRILKIGLNRKSDSNGDTEE